MASALISNLRAGQLGPTNDALWVRLLDVPAALLTSRPPSWSSRLSDATLVSDVEEHRAGKLREATRLLATLDAPITTTFF